MSVFVGRAQELQRLKSRYQAAAAGRGCVVFITGEPGAGKSTLTEQFLLAVSSGSPAPKIVDAACSEQYGSGEPYQPFIEAFRELLAEQGRAGGKSTLMDMAKEIAPAWLGVVPVVGNILEASVVTAMTLRDRKKQADSGQRTSLKQMAKDLAPEWAAAIPVVGDALGAGMVTAKAIRERTGGSAAPKASSEEALFFQYTELLLAAATTQPIILFIDDLHWADQASVTLLHHLGRKIEESRVLILGTYRPVDVEASGHPIRKTRQELERYGIAEEIQLAPLDAESLGQLLEGKLGAPPSPQLLEWLTRRAGTNPLFFGALTDWLVDQGFTRERQGEWDLVKVPQEIEIPRTAEAALERRLERLDDGVYRVLEYASVEGDEFQSVVLARLLEMDELQLEETLEPIERLHRLIRLSQTREFPNGEISSVYLFAHTLVQDILHRKLQGKRRIILHRKVAEILLELYGSETAEVDNKLAVHYHEGRLPERAYACAVLAADRAADMYAHLDATRLLLLALGDSQTAEQRIQVLDRLGKQHQLLGKFAEALDYFGEARGLAEERSDRLQAVSLQRKMLGVEMEYGKRPARELLDALKRLVREAGELRADVEVCQALWAFRKLPSAVRAAKGTQQALRKALDIAERLQDRALTAEAHYQLGTLLVIGGDPAEGIDHISAALQFGEELGDRERVGLCRNLLGCGHLLLGRYKAAIEEFEAAVAAHREAGDPVGSACVRSNLGVLLTRTGEWVRAEQELREALRIQRRLESRHMLNVLQSLAELYYARGDRSQSLEQWRALREEASATGYMEGVIIADSGIGILRLEEGDTADARACLESAERQLGSGVEWTESHEAVHHLAARLTLAEGDVDGALLRIAAAEEALRTRDTYTWAYFRLLRAEILAERDPTGAKEVLREALSTFEELGAEPMRRRAEVLLTAVGV